jgi:hypothetical protein
MTYLHHHYESDNNTKLVRMQQRVKAYQVIGNELYKTSMVIVSMALVSLTAYSRSSGILQAK